jgi:hypothetical protein
MGIARVRAFAAPTAAATGHSSRRDQANECRADSEKGAVHRGEYLPRPARFQI